MRAGEPDFLTKKVGCSAGLCEPSGSSSLVFVQKDGNRNEPKGAWRRFAAFQVPLKALWGNQKVPAWNWAQKARLFREAPG